MEKRVMSRINPYVSAKVPVSCSCCNSEVKPAMTIEKGYAVEFISLVEPSNPEIELGKEAEYNDVVSSNTIVKDALDEAVKDNTMPAVNSGVQDISMVNDDKEAVSTETEAKMVVCGIVRVDDEESTSDDETLVQKSNNEKKTSNYNKTSDDETDETLVQKSSNEMKTSNEDSDQIGDEESDPDVDNVQKVINVPRSTYDRIGQALDKTRLCLQKTNCTTMKRAIELSKEGKGHIDAIKKLVEENIPKEGSNLIEDLNFITKELFENLETLKEKMLDCQRKSLLDTINTLKQDVEAELATMDVTEQSEEELGSDESFGGSFAIVKEANWALYGFVSICAANVGFFSQPWLLQNLHTYAVNFTGYFQNTTFW